MKLKALWPEARRFARFLPFRRIPVGKSILAKTRHKEAYQTLFRQRMSLTAQIFVASLNRRFGLTKDFPA